MIPTSGICSDAAHSEKNKVTEYRVVDIETGKELSYANLGYQTTNIGEFLGLVAAIKIVVFDIKKKTTIYCDSKTAISWYKNKYTSSNKSNSDLMKASAFLLAMEDKISSMVDVVHWDSKLWGEIPADFGNK